MRRLMHRRASGLEPAYAPHALRSAGGEEQPLEPARGPARSRRSAASATRPGFAMRSRPAAIEVAAVREFADHFRLSGRRRSAALARWADAARRGRRRLHARIWSKSDDWPGNTPLWALASRLQIAVRPGRNRPRRSNRSLCGHSIVAASLAARCDCYWPNRRRPGIFRRHEPAGNCAC